MKFQQVNFRTQFKSKQNVSRRGVFNKLRRNCLRRRQLFSSSGAYCLIEHIILAQFPNPISSVRTTALNSCISYLVGRYTHWHLYTVRTESKNMYGHLIISSFRRVAPQENSVGFHIRRWHGNRKHGQKKTARPGCLWASTSLGFLHVPTKAESQTLRSVSANHGPSYSRHSCSSQHNAKAMPMIIVNSETRENK